jgi:hypothetical protein
MKLTKEINPIVEQTISIEEWNDASGFLKAFFGRLDKQLKKFNMTLDHLENLNTIDVWALEPKVFELIQGSAKTLSTILDKDVVIMQRMLFDSTVVISNYERRILISAFTQLYTLGKRLDKLTRKP